MGQTRAVIFDVGGVLARNMWEPMFDDLGARYGLERRALRRAGRLLWETFAYVPETAANSARDMERRYWQLFLLMFRRELRGRLSVRSLIELTDRYVVPVAGMRPILEALRARRVRLVVCSNNNEIWWERQERALRLARYFPASRLVLSSRVGAPKESARFEMFRAAVAAAGVPASACFFVDDRAPIVRRARQFGIDAVRFRGPAALARELRGRGLLAASA